MAKNIVRCTDGTWDGPVIPETGMNADRNNSSNVLKLFHNLAGSYSSADITLKDEQEKDLRSGDGAIALQQAGAMAWRRERHFAEIVQAYFALAIPPRTCRFRQILSQSFGSFGDPALFDLAQREIAYLLIRLAWR